MENNKKDKLIDLRNQESVVKKDGEPVSASKSVFVYIHLLR